MDTLWTRRLKSVDFGFSGRLRPTELWLSPSKGLRQNTLGNQKFIVRWLLLLEPGIAILMT